MFLWPDGSVTGSVDWTELQAIAARRDDKSVTEAGWDNLDSLLAERAGVAPEGSSKPKRAPAKKAAPAKVAEPEKSPTKAAGSDKAPAKKEAS